MQLELTGDKINEPLSEVVITDCLIDFINGSNAGNDSFVILSDSEYVIQVAMNTAGSFHLEYIKNEEIWECSNKSLSKEQLFSAFIRFFHSDLRWKSSLTWEHNNSADDSESNDFAVLKSWHVVVGAGIVIAFLIASPIAWFLMNRWLQDFAYRTQISWWVFAVAALAALVVTIAAVGFQTIKAAIANPIKSLRTE